MNEGKSGELFIAEVIEGSVISVERVPYEIVGIGLTRRARFRSLSSLHTDKASFSTINGLVINNVPSPTFGRVLIYATSEDARDNFVSKYREDLEKYTIERRRKAQEDLERADRVLRNLKV
jgi:hypothetical protein